VSGADEQQRDTAGRRGWWLVGLLAVIGAAVGAFAGHRVDPDVKELVPSLALAGLGLGGLIGLLLLAPVGLWRTWRRWAHRRAATRERAELPDGTGLWHTEDPGRESAAGVPGDAVVDVPLEKEPEPEQPPPPAGGEPGWYPDSADDDLRRYWDGQAWTGHVWRGRIRERTWKPRSRR